MADASRNEPVASSEYIATAPAYHGVRGAQYVLPNGAPEHERLDAQARHLEAMMGGRIVHAATGPAAAAAVRRVLDVGCGTGAVTEHLATVAFPGAEEVVGLDLSPVPVPGGGGKEWPANVRFAQGDVLTQAPAEWRPACGGDDEGGFDVVFSRLLIAGISDWPKYFRTVFGLLVAGGWQEAHDLDCSWYDATGRCISEDWPWFQRLTSAAESRGLDWHCGSRARARMEEAGYVDVRVTEYYWPFGGEGETRPEMRAFGEYVPRAMKEMFWHMIPKLMEGSGASAEEIEGMREAMLKDFIPEAGKRFKFYVTVGRKPEVERV